MRQYKVNWQGKEQIIAAPTAADAASLFAFDNDVGEEAFVLVTLVGTTNHVEYKVVRVHFYLSTPTQPATEGGAA